MTYRGGRDAIGGLASGETRSEKESLPTPVSFLIFRWFIPFGLLEAVASADELMLTGSRISLFGTLQKVATGYGLCWSVTASTLTVSCC